jgi:hypothetical protein
MGISHIPSVLVIIFIRKMMAGLKRPMFFWQATTCRNAGTLTIHFKLLNWALVPV